MSGILSMSSMMSSSLLAVALSAVGYGKVINLSHEYYTLAVDDAGVQARLVYSWCEAYLWRMELACFSHSRVDIGSVDLSQVITLQLVFSPAPWVGSVGYTLLVITIR